MSQHYILVRLSEDFEERWECDAAGRAEAGLARILVNSWTASERFNELIMKTD